MSSITELQKLITQIPLSVGGRSTQNILQNLHVLLSLVQGAIDFCNIPYEDLCELLPPELKSVCNNSGNYGMMKDRLDSIRNTAHAFQFFLASGMLNYYFYGSGTPESLGQPAWIEPQALFDGDGQNVLTSIVDDIMNHKTDSSFQPNTVLTPEFFQQGDLFLSQNQINYTVEYEDGSAEAFKNINISNEVSKNIYYALGGGGATGQKAGPIMITYTYDGNTVTVTYKQDIELQDRYDWRGEEIAVNQYSSDGYTVRLYEYYDVFPHKDGLNDFDDRGYNFNRTMLPPLAFNPVTNSVMVLPMGSMDGAVLPNGFIHIPFPPDSPSRGHLVRALREKVKELGGTSYNDLPVGTLINGYQNIDGTFISLQSRIFGSPDHPDPIERMAQNSGIGLLGVFGEDLVAADFHVLESRGWAKPFFVFSRFTVVGSYTLQIDPNTYSYTKSDYLYNYEVFYTDPTNSSPTEHTVRPLSKIQDSDGNIYQPIYKGALFSCQH